MKKNKVTGKRRRVAKLIALILAALLCGAPSGCEPPLPDRGTPPSPTAGVTNAELAVLLTMHWEIELTLDPITATYYGVRRFDSKLPPVRHRDHQALRQQLAQILARATAIDASSLDDADRRTLAVLVEKLQAKLGLGACQYERWEIAPRRGFVAELEVVGDYHVVHDAADARSLRARIAAMPAAIDAYGEELRAGAAAGLVSPDSTLAWTIDVLYAWAERPPQEWSLYYAAEEAELPDAEREALVTAVTTAIEGQLAPAYQRLADKLLNEVLPIARQIEGLAGLPNGAACYAAEIRRHTTLPMTAAELHALGLSEVARIEAQIVALGQELYSRGTLPEIRAHLAADPGQRFASEEELLDWVTGLIERSKQRVAPLFHHLPATPIELVPYPAYYGKVAAAYQASPDGVSPAYYYLTTQPPQEQTRWDLEATTYHEAVPGHHLQLGRAGELSGLPALRTEFNDTAYVEGWALYAETLADEIELYTDGAARIGRLANEALRAARLVVDTGLHAQGWTREQAIDYMEAHSMYTGNFVTSEVERYLRGPGQALAYKVGELEILRLRGAVQAREGAGFSLRDFHEAVLAHGSLPLPVLAGELLGAQATAARTPSGAALAAQGGGWRQAR